jgi:endonuclease/exonuclease/phosphatase family metal-dependent hydrolase
MRLLVVRGEHHPGIASVKNQTSNAGMEAQMYQTLSQFVANYSMLRTHGNGILLSLYKIAKYSNRRIPRSPRVW